MLPQLSVENAVYNVRDCMNERNLAYALHLHACMCKSGLEAYRSFGNYLVSMFAEVGSICNAQKIFNKLLSRNECSWNSLINGYINCGESRHAFTLYQKMQEDSLHPSGFTFVALLKACAQLKDAERGHEIHAEISRKGLLRTNLFVGNTLVDMYAKCGSLAKAQEVFDMLPVRDVVTWTALIAGYTQQGHGEEALNCFEQMQLEGASPNAVTFACILKSCGSTGATNKGREIHADIERKGLLERDVVLGSALVDMYAKCGLLAEAQDVFDKLPACDVVSWNALISGYVQHERGEEALNCLKQMRLKGVSPDAITFACSLRACGSIGATGKGREIHAEIARKGLLKRDLVLGNALVDMYAKCGMLSNAQEVFDNIPVRDVVSWTALITGYVEHQHGEKALKCFKQMQLEGVSPNAVMLACSLKACGSIGAANKGREIHAEIGLLERHLVLGNALVDMYAKRGLLAKAHEVFDKLRVRDAVTWTALIAGYVQHERGEEALICFKQMQLEGLSPDALTFACSLKACGSIGATDKGREIHAEIAGKGILKTNLFVCNSLVDMYAKCGSLEKAQEVFNMLPVRDVVTWTALIAGYVQHDCGKEALCCLEQMQVEGVSPNAVTFACILKACGSIGATSKGREIHADIESKGLLKTNQFVGNALVDMYAKCGMLARAREVFDNLPVRNVVSWNALIAGYAQLGEIENAIYIFNRMRGEGTNPNWVTFVSVLNACSHTGLVDKGQTYFEAMSDGYGITPTLEHHICMVDLLGRGGKLDRAVAMMQKTPFHANIMMWHSVLGSCREWGNMELGRQAFQETVQLADMKGAA